MASNVVSNMRFSASCQLAVFEHDDTYPCDSVMPWFVSSCFPDYPVFVYMPFGLWIAVGYRRSSTSTRTWWTPLLWRKPSSDWA